MRSEPLIPPGSRAVLIGVPHYQDDRYWSYPAVGNSMEGMRSLLVESGLCGWREDQVVTIVDPRNSGQLLHRLRGLARDTSGVLLLYFVGHGVLSEQGELCLAITDTDHDDPDATGLEYEKIRRMLYSGTPAATRIAILDCCYSGREIGLGTDGEAQLADLTATSGAYTLTAADDFAEVPPSSSSRSVPRTAFTGELLDLLTLHGIPGGPPGLTLGAIYPLLRQRLAAKSLPRPNQHSDDSAAMFVFARNAAPSAPGADPGAQGPPSAERVVYRLSPRERVVNRIAAVVYLACTIMVVVLTFLSHAYNIISISGPTLMVLMVPLLGMGISRSLNSQLALAPDGVHIRSAKSTFIRWSEIKAVLVEEAAFRRRQVRFVVGDKSVISPFPTYRDREFDQKVSTIRQWHARFCSPEVQRPGGWS